MAEFEQEYYYPSDLTLFQKNYSLPIQNISQVVGLCVTYLLLLLTWPPRTDSRSPRPPPETCHSLAIWEKRHSTCSTSWASAPTSRLGCGNKARSTWWRFVRNDDCNATMFDRKYQLELEMGGIHGQWGLNVTGTPNAPFVHSISFGSAESGYSTSTKNKCVPLATYCLSRLNARVLTSIHPHSTNNEFMKMASMGYSIFIASGDYGTGRTGIGSCKSYATTTSNPHSLPRSLME